MTNILIPMAGRGSRFVEAGYITPKPLIDIYGKPMIQMAVESLNIEGKYIFIVQKKHSEEYGLKSKLKSLIFNSEVVEIDGITEGTVCTTLLAKEYFDKDEPLIIMNSDQFIVWDSSKFISMMRDSGALGGVPVFTANEPKWSFVRLDRGIVTEVVAKRPVSNVAVVGIYYWRTGREYIQCAESMIEKNIRVNNEFYVCPVYNQALEKGESVLVQEVDEMWGLGTPQDLEYYLEKHK